MNNKGLDIESVLRPSRWVSDMQVIGAIPEYVAEQIGLPSRARSVFLHQEAIANICEHRHLPVVDSEFVLEHMPVAVLRPSFFGSELKGSSRRLLLVEFVRRARRYLKLVLRIVDVQQAGGNRSEIWVSTGYPLSDEAVRRYLRRGKLKPVVRGEACSTGSGGLRAERHAPPGVPLRYATQMP